MECHRLQAVKKVDGSYKNEKGETGSPYHSAIAAGLVYKGLKFYFRTSPTHACLPNAHGNAPVPIGLTKMAEFRFVLLLLLSLAVTTSTAENEGKGGELHVGEYLARARELGIISEDQLTGLQRLAEEMGGLETLKVTVEGGEGEEGELEEASVFMRMYNQLTLLNVLYFSGALLIMGAYTLFMTLAWELWRQEGLSVVMVVQASLFGAVGVSLWLHSEEYQFVGGL